MGHKLKTVDTKNTEKSPIHENADVNITCDFGDGDITRQTCVPSVFFRICYGIQPRIRKYGGICYFDYGITHLLNQFEMCMFLFIMLDARPRRNTP